MTRTCSYCGETSPASLDNCPSCGRSFATGQLEHVMTPPQGTAAPPADPNDGLYTRMALKAVDLSDTFNALFGEPMPGWRAEMGRPGMSTAGGRQALQHIGLRRSDGPGGGKGSGGGTLVVGTVDAAAARCEIRSYRRVDAMFRERYRRPLPIRAPDWDRFAQRLVQFFREEGMAVRVESGAGSGRDDETEELDVPSGSSPLAWIVIACLLVALVAGVITWAVLTRSPAPPPPGAVPAFLPAGTPSPAWPAGAPPGAWPAQPSPLPPLLPPLPPRISAPPILPPLPPLPPPAPVR